MKRPFKFRHTSEIAGGFVLLATGLLIAGIFFAARAQGWFEGKSSLIVVFDTQEGAFGLQEGAEIRIRDAVAGRVGPISPTENRQMSTVFIIKNHFMPLITKDSVAKVMKKFGVAGDSYVSIECGNGPPVVDGDVIQCFKDEEIMETVQRVLDELRTTLLPVFEDAKEIVTRVNSILASVDEGKGTAGSIIGDTEMRDDLRTIVENLSLLIKQTESVMKTAEEFLEKDAREVGGSMTDLLSDVNLLLTNEVLEIAGKLIEVENEANITLKEAQRLIKGVQRHWLFRKYIKEESKTVLLVPSAMTYLNEDGLKEDLQKALAESRLAGDSEAIARCAFNLAACHLARGEITEAMSFNEEARMSYRMTDENPVSTVLLEAEALRVTSNCDAALERIAKADDLIGWSVDSETKVEAGLIETAIRCDLRETDEARDVLRKIGRKLRKTDQPRLDAAAAGLLGRIWLCEGNPKEAGGAFLKKAEHLRAAESFKTMADALKASADAYGIASVHGKAGEIYYRAAASYFAQNDMASSRDCLDKAERAARNTDDDLLFRQIAHLREQGVKVSH